ncbi:Hypothetical predicted protein [Pelobates cultripes]|uniref:Uncharacterized protein n=1 Tax=Pelobates cultripes TaxID=61616 RepID=A0AAD1VXQ5_PELCU|nr:Hypothetical predicted protein [Pelobates cultripes]
MQPQNKSMMTDTTCTKQWLACSVFAHKLKLHPRTAHLFLQILCPATGKGDYNSRHSQRALPLTPQEEVLGALDEVNGVVLSIYNVVYQDKVAVPLMMESECAVLKLVPAPLVK